MAVRWMSSSSPTWGFLAPKPLIITGESPYGIDEEPRKIQNFLYSVRRHSPPIIIFFAVRGEVSHGQDSRTRTRGS